ncbi:hypothetical protein [Streptomyces sp. SID3343]|uniref:hypothetical protein n=1 Tax=Streptomyces sp. SID3343 TaxID=2690260 RepID=UPI00136F85EB|nr:hypothetical protein [Streptomyces sp. SID3343]MYW02346.1 hypothetical protein [Streptomyces sp. SID3343]
MTSRFRAFVGVLEAAAGYPVFTDAEWETALRAARQSALKAVHEANPASDRKDPTGPFVRAHLPELRVRGALVGRQAERAAMNAFVRARDPQAQSYMCWHAKHAAGKTALLADYVKNPPPNVDVLNYFVSADQGTNTRVEFVAEMATQIRTFLRRNEASLPTPRSPREWANLFDRAARKSAGRGRRLLLVIDGLDEDVAWSGPAHGDGARHPNDQARNVVTGGSIAALLPTQPDHGMRVVVSARRSTRLPEDVAAEHPLRVRECLRLLKPSAPAVEIERAAWAAAERLRADDLGRVVIGLLAVTGGGLRTADLAVLSGTSVEVVDGLVHGVAGRCLVLDDEVTETYALSHDEILGSVLRELAPKAAEHLTGLLHSWVETWRAAGWPEETPLYPLTGYLRLLDDPADRATFVLDARRQVRLAAVAGPDVALAQLDALAEVIDGWATRPDHLAPATRLAASRALLLYGVRDVPSQAPALFVLLQDVARARALARSAPSPVIKAARLAEVAVAAYRGGLRGAASIATEAAEQATRADAVFPCPIEDAKAYEELAEAARALHELGAIDAARALLRAVILSGAADVESLVAAVDLLTAIDGRDGWVALEQRAEHLSMGGPRARAAAVDIWATVARSRPTRAAHARARVVALCEESGPSDGLASVDVFALAASMLAKSSPRASHGLVRDAQARLSAALADPDTLAPADQAHLQRELGSTLTRLAQAVDDTGIGPDALDGLGALVAALPETLRTGVLGDDPTEPVAANIAASDRRRAAEEKAHWEQGKERLLAERRARDAANRDYLRQRKERQERQERQERKEREQPERSERREGPLRTGELRGQQSAVPAQQAVRHKASPRRAPSQGRPEALASRHEHDEQRPAHIVLLRHAGQLLRNDNHVLGRERLEAALRCSPPLRTSAAAVGAWTPALSQALGAIGEFACAADLAAGLPETENRVRHLAALSMGCSQGGHDIEARRYAQEAAGLGADGSGPGLRAVIAQALAHAGEAAAAVEVARRRMPGDPATPAQLRVQRRRALTAVAAGLVHRAPETAAGLVDSSTEALRLRIGLGGPFHPLPELAELLLACPDVRRPGPAPAEALRLAAAFVREPLQQWHPESAVVLALLGRIDCCAELPDVADTLDQWQRTLPPDRTPHAELAVLAAMAGDTAAALRLIEASPTPDGRAVARAAVATHLAGVPTVLAADRASQDMTLGLCLALAHAAGDGSAPDEAAARLLVRELLSGEWWAYAIPLLPRLAPEALVPLCELARVHGPKGGDGPTGARSD